MVNCAVFGCYNHSKKKPVDENASDVGFFSIPKVIVNQCKRTKDVTQRRRAEWLRRINRKDLDGSATHYRVCGKHFIFGRPSYAVAEADPTGRHLLILDMEIQKTVAVQRPDTQGI
ncbi:uncharacterized protein LOC142765302 [Rhipicephalus microplus]|uniref:uncharacterized protein LOC142765302 n=1 Tax=Rhipicephalus microplus TaxID=6941 RepID=UPI003F6ADB79